MSLTPAFLDELRARTLLSGLIGKSVKLQRAGREWRACCPFHNEKTPSFYVNDDKGFYHCFGCSAHGDAIRWMTDQRGLSFLDAVKELAAAAGMDMPQPDRQAAEKAERVKGLHEAMADAAHWFSNQLDGIEGSTARRFLDRRGVKAEVARAFGLGFAPDARGKLRKALNAYGDDALIEAGLLINVDGKEPYDRFRGRLIIPIRDPRGRVIAFGGRIIEQGEPKYLNSPETPLFDKSRTLYNLDRASPAARKTGRLIVVEGYMDAIALAQAGIDEAVAPLGTALTEHHLELLWRVSEKPILCFDGDAAGHRAAIRAAHRALPLLRPGYSLTFVTLPTGQDPDDVIASGGAQAIETLLNRSISLDEFLWRSELAGVGENAGPDERALLKNRLIKLAETISDQSRAKEYRRTFIDRFYATFGSRIRGLEVVREAIGTARRHPGRGVEYTLYRAVLLGLMSHPQILESHAESIALLPITDRYLAAWRDELVKLTYGRSTPLSEDIVHQLLQATSIWPIEPKDFKRDFAFSFVVSDADPTEAQRDLFRVITIILEDYYTKQAIQLANDALKREISQELFQKQQSAMRAALKTHGQLTSWLDQLAEAA